MEILIGSIIMIGVVTVFSLSAYNMIDYIMEAMYRGDRIMSILFTGIFFFYTWGVIFTINSFVQYLLKGI